MNKSSTCVSMNNMSSTCVFWCVQHMCIENACQNHTYMHATDPNHINATESAMDECIHDLKCSVAISALYLARDPVPAHAMQKRKKAHDADEPDAKRSISLTRHETADAMGLDYVVYRRLLSSGVPRIFLQILQMVFRHMGRAVRELACVEFFCGVASITQNVQQAGFSAVGYDIEKDPRHQDLCTPTGFLHAIWLVLCMGPDALAWFATVCSSWIFMSRATTCRSLGNALGRTDLECTVNGNCMVGRGALLQMLIMCSGSIWALEQPMSSLMEMHPGLLHLVELANKRAFAAWHTVSTSMGAFEADTAKPSILYSNSRWILSLARTLPKHFQASNKSTVVKHQGLNGTGVTGGTGLKQTQDYTWAFGSAVLDTFIFASDRVIEVEDSESELDECESTWASSELGPVMKFLTA